MRTLNRPMFRYGGPIKEGVMNGIREPKRNGGSMKAALVGNPVYPKTNGREHHAIVAAAPIVPAIMTAARAGLRYIPRGINYLKNLARKQSGTTTVPKQGPTFTMPGKTVYKGSYSGTVPGRTIGPGTGEVPVYAPNFLGRDPTVRLVGGVYKGITSPTATGIVQKGGKLVFSPTGIVTGLYLGGKYYNKDGKEIKKPKGSTIGGKRGTSGAPGGGDPDMYYDAPEKELTEAEKAKIESDNRIKQMEKYREIMDIKGMSKDAAYKSLIDAGKIIQEGGNLKEQLKSGKLITNLTQAASKRFDKVSDTEAALRSLIAKGEIDKEMNKDKNALDNAVKNAQLKAYNKQNEGLTTSEVIQKRLQTAKGEFPQGDELRKLISLRNPELNAKTLPSGDIPTNVDALDYIVAQVAAVNADETTPDYPEGVYVIKDRIIQVIDGQVVPISVNQLA